MSAPAELRWEIVCDTPCERVRRFPVDGGWIYQVERDVFHEPITVGEPGSREIGWGEPVVVRADVRSAPPRTGTTPPNFGVLIGP